MGRGRGVANKAHVKKTQVRGHGEMGWMGTKRDEGAVDRKGLLNGTADKEWGGHIREHWMGDRRLRNEIRQRWFGLCLYAKPDFNCGNTATSICDNIVLHDIRTFPKVSWGGKCGGIWNVAMWELWESSAQFVYVFVSASKPSKLSSLPNKSYKHFCAWAT